MSGFFCSKSKIERMRQEEIISSRGVCFSAIIVLVMFCLGIVRVKENNSGNLYAQTRSEEMIVRATVYNAVKAQTNSNPLKTADGSKIDKAKLKAGEIRWLAVSQDLRSIYHYGDKIEVMSGVDSTYLGVWEVHDTMNPRMKCTIDFLVPDHIKTGSWSKVRIKRVD